MNTEKQQAAEAPPQGTTASGVTETAGGCEAAELVQPPAAGEDISAQPASKREIRIVFMGLMLALALSAMDQNIVSTALPRIVGELGGFAHLSWVVTAFMLTSTVTTPLYGKLSDIYGRRRLFVISIVVFLAGSVLCGAAHSMFQMILFRGIQGLGAGGLMTLAQTTIADLIAPRERGRYQGIFAATFAVCSIAGPLAGGVITDVLSWRWIFFINLPVGAAALALILYGLKKPHKRVAHRIDYWGATLLTAGTACLLLLLTWGGAVYPWGSPRIVGLGLGAAALLAGFIWFERGADEPLLPLELFRTKVFSISVTVIGLTFMAMFSAAVFLPLFFQLVMGAAPAKAGMMMVPLMAGAITASIVGGRLVSTTGRYKIFPVIGLALAACAYLFAATVVMVEDQFWLTEITLACLGVGLGLVMPNLMTAIQNAAEPRTLGIATATSSFMRSLGGAVGVALAGTLMSYQLHSLLTGVWTDSSAATQALLDQGMQAIMGLPQGERDAVIHAYRHSIISTFYMGAVISALGFGLVLFLPELPLRSKRLAPAPAE